MLHENLMKHRFHRRSFYTSQISTPFSVLANQHFPFFSRTACPFVPSSTSFVNDPSSSSGITIEMDYFICIGRIQNIQSSPTDQILYLSESCIIRVNV